MDIGLPAILLGGLAYQGGTAITSSRQEETKSENQFPPESANTDTADNSSDVATTDNNLFLINIGLPSMLLNGLAYQGEAGVAPFKQEETKSENQFTPVSANNTVDNGSATTADNNLSDVENKPINYQMQEVCQIYCENIQAVAGQSISQDTKPEEPSVINEGIVLEPKGDYELAQVFTEFNASKLPSSTESDFNPSENRTTAGSPATARSAVTSALTSELLLTIDSGDQTISKTVLPQAFVMPLIDNCVVGEGKNCDEAPISGKTVVSEKYLANQVIAKKAATEILPDDGKTAADDEMSTPAPVFRQGDAGADKPAVSDAQKTLVDTSVSTNQNKSIDEFCLDKSAPLVKKPTDNKADASQQAVSNVQELSGSLHGKNEDNVTNNVLNDSILKKLNSEQIISNSSGTKDKGSTSTTNSNFQDNSPKSSKQIFSVNSAQYSVTEQFSAAASASKTANAALPGDVSTSVGKQIQESIHSSLKQGEQQITIRLDPPELGKVSIKLHEQDGQIVGLMEVSKAQTKTEIQQALPQIIQNLTESGIQVKRLEVMLTNQQEQQGFKDPSLTAGANGWSGQGQAGANSDPQGNNPSWVENNNEWLTSEQSYTSFIEPAVQITDDSINMLV